MAKKKYKFEERHKGYIELAPLRLKNHMSSPVDKIMLDHPIHNVKSRPIDAPTGLP